MDRVVDVVAFPLAGVAGQYTTPTARRVTPLRSCTNRPRPAAPTGAAPRRDYQVDIL
jgi:hypothetical protein